MPNLKKYIVFVHLFNYVQFFIKRTSSMTSKIIDECSSTLFVKIQHEKHSRKMSSRKTFTSNSSGLIPLEFQHNSGIHQGLDDVDLCPAATSNRVQLLALVHRYILNINVGTLKGQRWDFFSRQVFFSLIVFICSACS